MVVAIRHQASKIGSSESTPTYSNQCPSCQPPQILQYRVRVWIRLPLVKTRRGTSKLCNRVFLDQLVKTRKLKQFLYQLAVQGGQPTVSQRSNVPRSSLGTINVIFVAPREDPSFLSGVMTISPL